EDVVAARLEAARRLELLIQRLAARGHGDFRADRKGVRPLPFELYLNEPRLVRQSARVVAVDERRIVDVVHDQVERSVAVEIGVRGAAREARSVETPRGALVCERQIAVV